MFELRPYQRDAVDSMFGWFHHHRGNPLIVIPTAGGKSVIMGTFIQEAISQYPGTRILLVTHVKELLMQNADKLLGVWPEAPVGLYSAGIGRREADAQVLVAGIQSVWQRADEVGATDLVLVDECHLIPPDADAMYRQFLGDLRRIRSSVKVIGLTATPYRLGTGYLHQGVGAMFEDIAYEAGITDLVRDGYLCRLTGRNGAVRADLSQVHTRGGEFIENEMAAAFDREDITRPAVQEILTLGQGRRSIIVFCSSVAHAHHVSEAFQALGEASTAVISGVTPKHERDELVAAFKAGRIRVMCNCNILTTGFDAPTTDCLVFLRATKSVGLYVQMAGRGMRLSPGKPNCLVLDYAGNIERHGPVDSVRVRPANQREPASAPVKECPQCHTLLALAVETCPECGHAFPPREERRPQHETRATDAAVMTDDTVRELEVTATTFHLNQREGKKPSMRVDYECGLRTFSEWVCFQHEGLPRRKAEAWAMARGHRPPRTVADALAIAWPHARAITVNDVGRYPEILRVVLLTEAEQDARFLADLDRMTVPASEENAHGSLA